jgi:hypothetical protein
VNVTDSCTSSTETEDSETQEREYTNILNCPVTLVWYYNVLEYLEVYLWSDLQVVFTNGITIDEFPIGMLKKKAALYLIPGADTDIVVDRMSQIIEVACRVQDVDRQHTFDMLKKVDGHAPTISTAKYGDLLEAVQGDLGSFGYDALKTFKNRLTGVLLRVTQHIMPDKNATPAMDEILDSTLGDNAKQLLNLDMQAKQLANKRQQMDLSIDQAKLDYIDSIYDKVVNVEGQSYDVVMQGLALIRQAMFELFPQSNAKQVVDKTFAGEYAKRAEGKPRSDGADYDSMIGTGGS